MPLANQILISRLTITTAILLACVSTRLSAQASSPAVGDRVEAQDYGVWYPATVLAVKDGKYQIRWDSNSVPEWVEGTTVRAMQSPTPAPQPLLSETLPDDPTYRGPMSFRVGQRVEAQAYGVWYPGTVIGVGQGRYQIHWDSNTIPDWIEASRVRTPSSAASPAISAPLAGPPATPQTPATPTGRAFRVGERVTVKFHSVTNEATVLATRPGEYRVHYLDNTTPDEWVPADRVLPLDKGDTASGPPLGRYMCYLPVYEHTYVGSFVLRSGGSYQYLTGTRGAGQYRYDASDRNVTFSGGPLAGKVVGAEYENTKQNGPVILLIFPKGRRAGDVQNCLYRP